jgi:type II secretory pathway pseudopilin PulG
MQEDLLGYLLGALEADEMQRVEKLLRESPEAREMLADLERKLGPLHDDCEVVEPPPTDLVARTLDSLPPLPPMPGMESSPAESPADSQVSEPTARKMSPVLEGADTVSWTWRDWVGSFTAACILLAIALPSMVEGRFMARKQACQDNLRQLGMAMTQYVNRNAEARLPSVESAGYQAFAGVYAPRLHAAGLMMDPRSTHCPSIRSSDFWNAGGLHSAEEEFASEEAAEQPTLVTLRMLDAAARDLDRHAVAGATTMEEQVAWQRAIARLQWLQQTAGGHYAYTLGVRDGEEFASPRFQGRSSFAVMSDAAIMKVVDRVVENEEGWASVSSVSEDGMISHGGRGINVLYEDGRVRFVPRESLSQLVDHPLVNHEGRPEAGVNIDDASLAPSWQAPFVHARQR